MARPSPVPPKRRVVELSACTKGWKIRSIAAGAMPMPESATTSDQLAGLRRPGAERGGQRHLPGLGELDGVADEVEEDLAEPRRVAAERHRRHVVGEVELDALARGLRPEHRLEAREQVAKLEVGALDLARARLDLREVEDVVQDVHQRLARVVMTSTSSRCSRVSSVWASSPVRPSTPFIGVRISWLMVARKLLFARLAASAASFCSSSALQRSWASRRVFPCSARVRTSAVRRRRSRSRPPRGPRPRPPVRRGRREASGSRRAPPRRRAAGAGAAAPWSGPRAGSAARSPPRTRPRRQSGGRSRSADRRPAGAATGRRRGWSSRRRPAGARGRNGELTGGNRRSWGVGGRRALACHAVMSSRPLVVAEDELPADH